MFGRVGLDLAPVQADLAHLQKTQSLGQQQDLDKQRLELLKKPFAEGGEGVMIRMRVGGDVAEGNRVVGRLLQFPAGEHARRIAVKQQRQQHLRVEGFRADSRVGHLQLVQVQLRHHIDDEAGQMLLGKPVLYRRRKQVEGLSVHRFEVYAHALNTFPASPRLLACSESPTGY